MKRFMVLMLTFVIVMSSICISAGAAEADEAYTAPVFYGTQKRTNDNGTIDIRFVSVTNSLAGEALGYEITASWWDVAAKIYKTRTYSAANGHTAFESDTVYSSVIADGKTVTATDIGSKINMNDALGLSVVSLNGVPTNAEIVFDVKTYVKDEEDNIVAESKLKTVIYDNGEATQNRVIYFNDFDDAELDIVYDDENSEACNSALSDAIGWIGEPMGVATGTAVKTTYDGKLNLTQLQGQGIRGFTILPANTIFGATNFKLEMDVAVNSLGLVDLALGSTYNSRNIASAQFRAYSNEARTSTLSANDLHSADTSYLGIQGYKCGGNSGSSLGLNDKGWGQEFHLEIEVDVTNSKVTFYADGVKIFNGAYNGTLDGGLCLLLCMSDITIDNLLITGDGINTELTVGATPIEEYSIAYGDSQMQPYAEQLADIIQIVTGEYIPVVADSASVSTYELWVGATNRNSNDSASANGFKISVDGNKMKFIAEDDVASEMMMTYVLSELSQNRSEGIFDLNAIATEHSGEDTVRMMTFNVLGAWNSSDGERVKKTADMILANNLDIICLQEFDIQYRNSKYGGFLGWGGKDFNTLVSGRFAEVTVSGVDSQYIWNPIYYNKTKFEVVESGFTDMYAEGVPCYESLSYTGGGDGRSHFRTLVWAVLRDKTTSQRYLVGNLHYSAANGDHDAESAWLISRLADVRARYTDAIVLVGGDYNSTVSGGACKNMLDAGYENTLNMTSLKGRDENGVTVGNNIDNILTVYAESYKTSIQAAVAIHENGITELSDHIPIVIQFKVNSGITEKSGTQPENEIQGTNWIG